LAGQLAHIADRLIVVDRFEMIFKRLAADRDPLLDDKRRLGGVERVPLNGVRGVGELQIVNVLKVAEAGARHGTQPVKLGFFCGGSRSKVVHTLFLSQVVEQHLRLHEVRWIESPGEQATGSSATDPGSAGASAR